MFGLETARTLARSVWENLGLLAFSGNRWNRTNLSGISLRRLPQFSLIPMFVPWLGDASGLESGRHDSNVRRLGPKPSALTRLSYTPYFGWYLFYSFSTTVMSGHIFCFFAFKKLRTRPGSFGGSGGSRRRSSFKRFSRRSYRYPL